MHILHIFDHSLPLHSGYAFRSRSIIREQRRRGWKTSHLTSSKHYPPGNNEETVDGLRFYRTPAIPRLIDRLPIVNQYAVVAWLARRLRQVCRHEKPDVLHAHSPCLMGLAALKVAREQHLPIVYEMRASWEDAAVHHGTTTEESLRYRVSRALESRVLRQADAVTTICEGLRADILSRGVDAGKVTVIPNGVDVERFNEQPPDTGLARELGLENKRVLGFAGSFYAYEGLPLLLEAARDIRSDHPDVRVLLVGGGPEEERLKSLSTELGLDDIVLFTGRVPHDQVEAYYSVIDILVYPRLSGRLTDNVTPLKPLEAMALRRLVVASDVGGHRELIRPGETGVLFEANKTASLAAALVDLLGNTDRWPGMRSAGRLFVEQERTWARSIAGYEQAYARALGSHATD